MDIDLDTLGSVPISENSPAGEDARYEPEYATLLAEIEKLSSLTAGSAIAWPVVMDSASFILRNKSKDLLVSCYLGVALVEVQGLAGLPAGLRVLTDFATHFWETGFPAVKRMRGRVNALDWWRERISNALSTAGDGSNLPADLCTRIEQELTALDTAIGEVMPDYMPLRDLREATRRLPVEPVAVAPQIEAAPIEPIGPIGPIGQDAPVAPGAQAAQAAPSPSHTAATTTPKPAPVATPTLTDDASKLNAQFMDFALNYAFAGHAINPADPLPWQALRLGVWGKLNASPPAEGNTTFLPAPDMDRKPFLEQQTRPGNPPATLLSAALNAENLFPAAMFWLDLQRIIHEALSLLGSDYRSAAQAVRTGVTDLLARCPGLADKTFADGTPFADAGTREWLATFDDSGASGASSLSTRQTLPTDSAIAEAEATCLAGDLAGALRILDNALLRTVNGAARLPLRLAQCACLRRSSQWAGAAALADALVEELDRRDLSTWNQQLALDILLAAHEAWEGFGGETGTARAFALNNRMHRLAPSYGIRRG